MVNAVTMRGRRIIASVAIGAVVGGLAIAGCKKGKQSSTVAGPKSEPATPSGTMSLEGMYSYMADAGLFLDCARGERWPVAMEGDNAALERAYGRAKVDAGSPLLVAVEGRLEPRPKVDAPGEETTLVVERFVRAWPKKTCATMKTATLEDTYWALLELGGTPVDVETGDRAPFLELNEKKQSAYGFGGCNRFFGSYESSGESLTFGALGATRMACPEGMDREQELFTVLGTVNRYEIDGRTLRLFADDTLVARFEARPRPAE